MSRTQGRDDCDTPFTDGKLFYGIMDIFIQAGGGAVTRNAAGDVSINQAASQAGLFVIPLNSIIERTGVADFLQEQFGGANTPAGVSGIPPFTGATQLVPVTGFRPKGIKITDITLHYLIGTNPLSLHTIRVDKVVYVNNVALAITPLLANAANGLATAAQANPYTTKVPITPANIAFNQSDNSEIIVEVAATTPAGGTYRLYGATVHCAFNYS